MKRTVRRKMLIAVTMILAPSLVLACEEPAEVQKPAVLYRAYRMQIPFIENQGQLESDRVRFYAQTFGGALFVDEDGSLTYSLPLGDQGSVILKETVTGAKPEVKGLIPSSTRINYFKGNDKSKWKTTIPSYESISLGEVYKGVELELKAYGKNVEKLFTVHPQGDPELIKIKLQGAKELKVNDKGELEALTEHGPITFTKPYAYQEIDGKRVEIDASYKLTKSKFTNPSIPKSLNPQLENPQPAPRTPQHFTSPITVPPTSNSELVTQNSLLTYGFNVASYDKNHPLIIDPLLASTFIGGSDNDHGNAIALDREYGYAYITGETQSADYPINTEVVAVGNNTNGQCNVGSWTDVEQVSAGIYHTVGLQSDGTVVAVGSVGQGQCNVGSWSDIVQVSAGGYHTVGLQSDGTVVAVGETSYSQCDVSSWSDIVQVAAGYRHTVGLQSDGTVVAVGWNSDSQCNVGSWSDIQQVAAGSAHTVGLQSDGTVVAVGRSSDGQCNVGSWSGIQQVAAGGYHTVGLQSYYGTVVAVGENDDGQCNVGSWSGIEQVAAGGMHTIGLESGGTVVAVGWNDDGQCNVGSWSDIKQVAAGWYHTAGVSGAAVDITHNDNRDVFISKLDFSLGILEATTFIGGSSNDTAYAIALDDNGPLDKNIYVTGVTSSDNYPTTVEVFNESHNGNQDVFISRLNDSLDYLEASTYIGGSSNELASSILIGDLSIFITGYAQSDYPTTTGPTYSGGWDVFVSRLSKDLMSLTASTYIGESGNDYGEGIANLFGDIFITGSTTSVDFPTTLGAYDRSYNGGDQDAFVSKLSYDLSTLEASTFIGGAGREVCGSIAVDERYNVYIAGYTTSSHYPTSPTAYNKIHSGQNDVFVSVFNSDLSKRWGSTLIGGSGNDYAFGLALDGCGNVYVTGQTNSSNYPTLGPTGVGPYDDSYNYYDDGFVSHLDRTLSFLFASTFIGGGSSDTIRDLALDKSSNVFITGSTASSEYPTPGGYDQSHNGANDVCVSQLDGFLSAGTGPPTAAASFLSEPTDVSFALDVDGEGPAVGCAEIILCSDQEVTVKTFLINWDSDNGDVTAIDYYFTWPGTLEVQDITCSASDFTNCTVPDPPPPPYESPLLLQVADPGVPGPVMQLHTITLKANTITTPSWGNMNAAKGDGHIDTTVFPSGFQDPVTVGQIDVNAICGGDTITCEEEDNCDLKKEKCDGQANVTEEPDNKYFWASSDGDQYFCKGENISIFRTRNGYYPVDTTYDGSCGSECLTECYPNCAYAELDECNLKCVKQCTCPHCGNLDEPQECYETQNRIYCSIGCYNMCEDNKDGGTSFYNHQCGFYVDETIEIRHPSDANCGGTAVDTGDPWKLRGISTAALYMPLPLDPGTYDICAGNTMIGDPVTVTETGCPVDACRIVIPHIDGQESNTFAVVQGVDDALEDIKIESEVVDEVYSLSMFQYDSDTGLPYDDLPASLRLPLPPWVQVSGGEAFFDIDAIDPEPISGKSRWINVIIKAEGSATCEAMFTYEIEIINQCQADFDGDGNVYPSDLSVFLGEYGRTDCLSNPPCEADFDDDGNVYPSDLSVFLGEYGRTDCLP